MSSVVNFLSGITLSTALHLLGIILIALLVNHFLKVLSKLIIKPASGQSRAAHQFNSVAEDYWTGYSSKSESARAMVSKSRSS